MKDIIILIAGGYIGWWLALNKEQETRRALSEAQVELGKAKNEIVKQIKENEEIKVILEDKGVFKSKETKAVTR